MTSHVHLNSAAMGQIDVFDVRSQNWIQKMHFEGKNCSEYSTDAFIKGQVYEI